MEESVRAATSNPRKGHRRDTSGHICTACDQCYRCKVKCSAEKPICERCRANGSACTYSTGKPLGKPKGSKNKVQRPKVNSDSSRRSTAPKADKPPNPDWQIARAGKRGSDGELPPAKRRESVPPTTSHGDQHSVTAQFPSPDTHTWELHDLMSGLGSTLGDHDTLQLVAEPVPYCFETVKVDSLSIEQDPIQFKVEDVFDSPDANLRLEDFYWFTQADNYMASPPSAGSTLSDTPMPEQHTLSTQLFPSRNGGGIGRSFQDTTYLHGSPPPCLCDPTALGIISELQFLQIALSPLDTALLLARRGFSTVSSCLSCPSCLSSSRSLFYACVLIIQQVFTCYGTVRMQGSKMLNFGAVQEPQHSVVSIGDFEVESEEGCHGVLDAIVKAEMERGKGVIGGLERWAETAGDGSQKTARLLLRTLREEIGC